MSKESGTPLVPGSGTKMRVGVNYPWYTDKYGIYLGDASMPWESDFEDFIKDCGKVGVKTFRVFLLCNLHTYGTVDATLHTGWATTWYTYKFNQPPAAPEAFVKGLVSLLKIAAKYSVKLILSHSDFPAYCLRGGGTTKRYEIIIDAAMRAKFFKDVLRPMLVASKPYGDYIESWEIMNEPRWATQGGGVKFNPVVSLAEMTTFLTEGLAMIADNGFTPTVGHACYDDLAKYPTGTLRQFHYYPGMWTTLNLPTFAASNSIIGEFSPRVASSSMISVTGDMESCWPALKGKDCVDTETATFERLVHLHKMGYGLALLWPDQDALDGVRKISAGVQLGLRRFQKWVP